MPLYKFLLFTFCLYAPISYATTGTPDAPSVANTTLAVFALPHPDQTEPMPYAGGGNPEDALYICCAAGLCTYSATSDCSLLSSTGKMVALSVTGVGGVTGFALGFIGGSLLLNFDDNGNIVPYGSNAQRENNESILALGFLAGAVGLFVGSSIGLLLGLVVSPFCTDALPIRPASPPHPRPHPPAQPSPQPPPRMGASVFSLAE